MKKNILFLITKSEIGGAQRFVQEQIAILAEQEYPVFLVTNQPGWLSANAVYDEVGFHSGIESKASLSFLCFLCRFIRRHKIDLLVCNSANGGLYGRLAAAMMLTKAVYVSHGWSSVYNGGKLAPIFNFAEKVLAKISAGVLCISENDYEVGLHKIGIQAKKLTLMPNAIYPLKNLSPKLDSPILKLLMVCRLDHPKKPDLLVKAVKEIGNDIRLTIVGDGPMMQHLIELLEPNCINIELKGEINGFKDFAAYDVFALISASEGLPISALEAMSAGLALLLSNVGGCPSLIAENGVLVANEVESIKQGILAVKVNLQAFKAASKKRFDDYHNLSINAPKYISYYNSKAK